MLTELALGLFALWIAIFSQALHKIEEGHVGVYYRVSYFLVLEGGVRLVGNYQIS